MGGLYSKLIVSLIAASLLAPLAFAAEQPAPVTARDRAIEAIAATGLDVERVLASPIVIETARMDGTVVSEETTVREVLDAMGFDAPLSTAGAGVAGTPETSAGNAFHYYINIVSGGSALAYRVQDSTLAPATPPVTETAALPGAVFSVGGPLRSVKASGYVLGSHFVGTGIGSNVDTHGNGPYLPLANAELVIDTKVDFVGHATVSQGQTCIFGFCIAFGQFVGDGAALWSESSVDLPAAP